MVPQLDTRDELTVPHREAFLGINLSCIYWHDGVSLLEEVDVYITGKTRNAFHRQASCLGNARYRRSSRS